MISYMSYQLEKKRKLLWTLILKPNVSKQILFLLSMNRG